MSVVRCDGSTVCLSTFFRIHELYLGPVSAATDLSLDVPRDGRLPARYLPVTHRRNATVWTHIYLRRGTRWPPGRRTLAWSGTDGSRVLLARLCTPRQTVQGKLPAHQPYPSSHWRTTFPVSVSRLQKTVLAEREAQVPRANAHG